MTHASDSTIEEFPDPVIHEFAPVARELLACNARFDLLDGTQRDVIVKYLQEAIAEANPSVLSMDVFDTFLLRNDKSEARRFYELSAFVRGRIADALKPPSEKLPGDLDFLVARVDAMALCYRTRKAVEGCREGRIRDIIRVSRRALDLRVEAEAIFLDAELDYEVENLRINPALFEVAQWFRKRGGRVVLISDMYLGKDEIAEVIARLDPSAATVFDEIFSSADHGVSKRAGKIFGLIERESAKVGIDFLLIGDALEGDVFRARAAGWGALHFPISNAESARRSRDLARFGTEMQALGCDVTQWAKV